jgi:hypothetical protein
VFRRDSIFAHYRCHPGKAIRPRSLRAAAEGRQLGFNEDESLEIKDVAAGNCQVVVRSPAEKYRDWYTKSVLVAGREVADTGFAVSGETAVEVVVNAKGASIARVCTQMCAAPNFLRSTARGVKVEVGEGEKKAVALTVVEDEGK